MASADKKTSDVELIIIDNASPNNVEADIRNVFPDLPVQVKFYRNKINVGGNANILRVIEYASADFVLVLGDDDHVLPNSIEKILTQLEMYPDALFINFNTPLPGHTVRTKVVVYEELLSFLKGIDSFGQIMFISDGLYNIKKIEEGIRFGTFYQNTCAPGFVSILYAMLLNNGVGQIVLSNERIIDLASTADTKTQMSIIPVVEGLGYLAHLNVDAKYLKYLQQSIVSTQKDWLTYQGAFRSLVCDLHNGVDRKKVFLMHYKILKEYYFLDRSYMKFILRFLLSLSLFSKVLTKCLLMIAGIMLKRKFSLSDDEKNYC
ncbi:glycosyltransferase family 2 protein [Marinomonas pontica]|nr:glycosyltransferase family 2 protein [Marinomonas pontica]